MLNPVHSFPVEIISFGLWMQKQGYRKSTVRYCIQALKSVARKSNILDPDSAKTYLANAELSEARNEVFRRRLSRKRQRLAIKLQNPRLNQIIFKTLRHFKATMEYHRTKDILHVMQLLGHKNIRNTLVYTHLVTFDTEDNYVCKVAKTVKEAQELVELGFDFITDVEGYKLFRKRK